MFGSIFNEANEPSSACRLWRIFQVETSTPPKRRFQYDRESRVGQGKARRWERREDPGVDSLFSRNPPLPNPLPQGGEGIRMRPAGLHSRHGSPGLGIEMRLGPAYRKRRGSWSAAPAYWNSGSLRSS